MQSPFLASRARMIGLAAATAIIMGILLAANNVMVANAQQQQTTTTKMEKVWETATELKTPESVIYVLMKMCCLFQILMEHQMERTIRDSFLRFHLLMVALLN